MCLHVTLAHFKDETQSSLHESFRLNMVILQYYYYESMMHR